MTEPLVALSGIHKSYGIGTEVETEVLHGIGLELARGEFAALIGPSGSGKSTLLNLIGLLESPTSGSYRLQGREVATLDDDELTRFRATSLGFVFQFHHLLPAFTATENVLLPGLNALGPVTPERREAARQLLREVGLGDRLDHPPGKLSGGQQQRVAIARALSLAPPLVLADEPTGNLDTHSADDIFRLMRRFNEERGVAFLIVTHDPRLARRCDRIVELVDGRIAGDRPNAAVRESPPGVRARARQRARLAPPAPRGDGRGLATISPRGGCAASTRSSRGSACAGSAGPPSARHWPCRPPGRSRARCAPRLRCPRPAAGSSPRPSAGRSVSLIEASFANSANVAGA